MKKLLVPTDFSNNAYHAADYAAQLAIKQQYGVHILHCYTALSSGFSDTENIDEDSHTLKADITMKEWVEKLQNTYPTLAISYSNERGLLEEVIPQQAEQGHYEAIVMGTTGASVDKNIFWGSNTALVIGKATIPVIAIPNIAVTTNSDKVGLLTNFKPEELLTLQEFLQLYNKTIDLELIHIYDEHEDVDEVKAKLEAWIFNIRKFNHIEKIGYVISPTVKDDRDLDTIPEVIAKLVDVANIETILVSKSRKSFFQRLFTPSISKAMALDLQTPAFFSKTI